MLSWFVAVQAFWWLGYLRNQLFSHLLQLYLGCDRILSRANDDKFLLDTFVYRRLLMSNCETKLYSFFTLGPISTKVSSFMSIVDRIIMFLFRLGQYESRELRGCLLNSKIDCLGTLHAINCWGGSFLFFLSLPLKISCLASGMSAKGTLVYQLAVVTFLPDPKI